MSQKNQDTLCCFPKNVMGKIVGFDNDSLKMPNKILEMGLLPDTVFQILYQAPFNGPLYIEYGQERSKLALRVEEAKFIQVEVLSHAERK